MNAQDKNDEKQQRPDGGYWAEARNDPGATKGEVSNGQGGGSTASSPSDDDSNLTGTDSQPGDEAEQEHSMHMSGQPYDTASKDPSRGPSPSTMKEDEELFDEGQATTPGTSGQASGQAAASSSSGSSSNGHTAGSGGSGTGESGALSHESGSPGLAGGTSASGTPDEAEGDVTLGSGGTGAGLPDGAKGN
ncbi:MAG: hypothetical protein JWQ11_4672 [Rhizobacter sp.]|nr:hypothetical protein [Rhizobacter sp.]